MKIEMHNVNELKPYGKNPRVNDKSVDVVAKSIKRFGFNQPIVVDHNMVIVVGHTRHSAALRSGIDEVPVYVLPDDTPDNAVRAYRILDNKAHDFTTWDAKLLKDELNELEDTDLDMVGFKLSDLDKVLFPELVLVGKDEKRVGTLHEVVVECDKDNVDDILAELDSEGYKCQKMML